MFALGYISKTHVTRAISKLSLGARIGHSHTHTYPTAANTITPALYQNFPLPILHTRSFTTTPLTMAPLTAWTRLIRYVSAKDGSIKYGEPIVSESKPDIDALAQAGGLKVKVLSGASPILAKPTGEEDEVKTLLGPLEPKDVPIVRCVGLNYRTHSKPYHSHSLNIPLERLPLLATRAEQCH